MYSSSTSTTERPFGRVCDGGGSNPAISSAFDHEPQREAIVSEPGKPSGGSPAAARSASMASMAWS